MSTYKIIKHRPDMPRIRPKVSKYILQEKKRQQLDLDISPNPEHKNQINYILAPATNQKILDFNVLKKNKKKLISK